MRVLLAVIKDLYTFAAYVLFGWYRRTRTHDSSRLPVPYTSGLSTAVAETALEPITTRTVEEILKTHPTLAGVLPQKNTIVYCAQVRVPLRSEPDMKNDTALAMLSYGEMLMILEAGEVWSFVASGNKKGYVPTSVLVQKAADVYPEFIIGGENGPRSENAARLRSIINDEFSAGLSQSPLGAHEYVYYKLVRRGVKIVWPDIRPRTSGTWERILGSVLGVSVTSEPVAGAVLECVFPEGKTHLAYIEKVFPDGAIHISEADWPDRGIYNERVLVEEEWRSLSPVFLTFA